MGQVPGQVPFGRSPQTPLALFERRVLQLVVPPMWYGSGHLAPRMLDDSYVNIRSCYDCVTDG